MKNKIKETTKETIKRTTRTLDKMLAEKVLFAIHINANRQVVNNYNLFMRYSERMETYNRCDKELKINKACAEYMKATANNIMGVNTW